MWFLYEVHLFSCRHVVLTHKVSDCVVLFVGISQQHNPTFLISKTTEVQSDVHTKCDFELCGNLHFLLLLFWCFDHLVFVGFSSQVPTFLDKNAVMALMEC